MTLRVHTTLAVSAVSDRLDDGVTIRAAKLVQLGMNVAFGHWLRYTVDRSKDGLRGASRPRTDLTAVVQSISILHP